MKASFFPTLLLTLCLSWTTAHAETIRLAYDAGFGGAESLDPFSPTRFFLPTQLLYNRLVYRESDGSAGPELALSWDVSDDAKIWTFYLRPEVKFHDGKIFNAQDVVYSLEHALDPKRNSPLRSTLKIIEHIEVVDSLTVKIHLNSAHADFPLLLLDHRCSMIADGSADTLDQTGNGTGPYTMQENDPEGITTLKSNTDYWDGAPFIDTLEIIAIPDQVAQIQAMLAGQIDYLPSINRRQLKLFENQEKYAVQTIRTGHWPGMVMRTDQPPFDDYRVRKALRLVIDREQMVKLVLGEDGGEVACDSPVWSGDQYHVPMECPTDIEQAKQLLSQAGYQDGIDIDFYTSAVDKSFLTMAEVYQQQAAAAGINVRIHQVPVDGYWTDTWMQKSFVSTRWNQRPADQILNEAFRSGASWNETYWNNPLFDRDISEARREVDADKRYSLYSHAQHMIYEEGGTIIPFHLNMNRVLSSQFSNLPPEDELFIQWHLVDKK